MRDDSDWCDWSKPNNHGHDNSIFSPAALDTAPTGLAPVGR
jgi:hypothetical protein